MGRQVYVETFIRADLDTVWAYSQDPDRHQRWDARFLGIEYLPGTQPQAFRYGTVAGGGVGVTAGERHNLHLYVDGRGGLHIRSGLMRFRESRIDLALPELSTGVAALHEWYDERAERFRIEVRVTHRWLGYLFGYRGTFGVRYLDTTVAPVPAAVKPYREEVRY